MVFPTASTQPRPIRLNEQIRDWAWRSMHGEFGDDAMTHMAVSLDHLEDFDSLPDIDRQDIALRMIAERAPLRICPEELLCGAATLGNGIIHYGPAESTVRFFLFFSPRGSRLFQHRSQLGRRSRSESSRGG